jgi:hypothetical protein
MPRKKREPASANLAILYVKFLPEDRGRSLEFDSFYIDKEERIGSGFSVKRQEVRLKLLIHMEEFRDDLTHVMEAFLGRGIGQSTAPIAFYLIEDFEMDWQVELKFWQKPGMSFSDLNKLRRKKNKKLFNQSLAPWIYDLKNMGPQLIDPFELIFDESLNGPKGDKLVNNFLFLKIPYAIDKQELIDYINRCNLIETTTGKINLRDKSDENFGNQLEKDIKLLTWRRYEKWSFRKIAIQLDPSLENKIDQRDSSERNLRLRYKRILNKIIDPPLRIKRK